MQTRVAHALAVQGAASDVVAEVRDLRKRADRLCIQAEATNDPRVALLAIRELTRLLELQGRLTLEASTGRASDVAAHPVWHQVSTDILNAIAGCQACTRGVHAVIARRLGVEPDLTVHAEVIDGPLPFP